MFVASTCSCRPPALSPPPSNSPELQSPLPVSSSAATAFASAASCLHPPELQSLLARPMSLSSPAQPQSTRAAVAASSSAAIAITSAASAITCATAFSPQVLFPYLLPPPAAAPPYRLCCRCYLQFHRTSFFCFSSSSLQLPPACRFLN